MVPPALKNALRLALFENVIECSTVWFPAYLVPDRELCNSELSAIAVAPVLPPATAAARLAKSDTSADLMAMASPAETDDAVIETFVWLAMLSMPVNSAFQLDALIVSPADTVAIAVCPNPYTPAPVPAKWL